MSTIDKIKSFWTQYFPPDPTFTESDVPAGSQKGRTFLVTGGNGGLGYELCKLLYSTGATVYMGARSTVSLHALQALWYGILSIQPSSFTNPQRNIRKKQKRQSSLSNNLSNITPQT